MKNRELMVQFGEGLRADWQRLLSQADPEVNEKKGLGKWEWHVLVKDAYTDKGPEGECRSGGTASKIQINYLHVNFNLAVLDLSAFSQMCASSFKCHSI